MSYAARQKASRFRTSTAAYAPEMSQVAVLVMHVMLEDKTQDACS